MQEAYRDILFVTGLMILLLACIIVITFLVWVVKLEFEWFFGLSIFKWLKERSLRFKFNLLRRLKKTKDGIDDANDQGEIKIRKKNVKLNEDMN